MMLPSHTHVKNNEKIFPVLAEKVEINLKRVINSVIYMQITPQRNGWGVFICLLEVLTCVLSFGKLLELGENI